MDWQFNIIDYQFRVNVMGLLLVIQCLLKQFLLGSKVVLIISWMGLMVDNGFGGYYGYWMSKVVFNVVGVFLVNDFKVDGIVVGLFYFGFV